MRYHRNALIRLWASDLVEGVQEWGRLVLLDAPQDAPPDVYEHILEDALLRIELVRELPETMKPRRIPIGATEQITHDQAA